MTVIIKGSFSFRPSTDVTQISNSRFSYVGRYQEYCWWRWFWFTSQWDGLRWCWKALCWSSRGRRIPTRRCIRHPLQEIHPSVSYETSQNVECIWKFDRIQYHFFRSSWRCQNPSKWCWRPAQVEGRADVEGWQHWLRVDGLCGGRKPCGADWAVCWLYAASWYVRPVLLSYL